jgi:hypothetical protein
MKNITFLIIMIPIFCLSQKLTKNKFSMDFTGGYYSNLNTWKENGVSGGYEFSYQHKSITYSANISVGWGISKNIENRNGYIQAFLESDLLIGKKFHISNSISINPQVGVGYLHYTNHFQEAPKNMIGLPIQTKILFFDDKSTSIGIVPHININNTQNNFIMNLTLNVKL